MKRLVSPKVLRDDIEMEISNKVDEIVARIYITLHRTIQERGYELYLRGKIKVDLVSEQEISGVCKELFPVIEERASLELKDRLNGDGWYIDSEGDETFLKAVGD